MRQPLVIALCLASLFARSSLAQTPPRHSGSARPAALPAALPAAPRPPARHTVVVAAPVVIGALPTHPARPVPAAHPAPSAASAHPHGTLAARPTAPSAPAAVTPPARALAPPAASPTVHPEAAVVTREEARNVRRRDPCEETLRAVEFEDHTRAEDAWRRCRATLAPPSTTPGAEALTRLELVASALQSLRRTDGAFCVAPSAPFDLDPWVAGVTDARQCFVALDRFLGSELEIRRWILTEPYAAGRLALRAGVEIAAGRTTWPSGQRVDAESVAIARLAGRRFMRVCRCLPGPQPETEAAVRAMHLPAAVERVLLAGIAERRAPAP